MTYGPNDICALCYASLFKIIMFNVVQRGLPCVRTEDIQGLFQKKTSNSWPMTNPPSFSSPPAKDTLLRLNQMRYSCIDHRSNMIIRLHYLCLHLLHASVTCQALSSKTVNWRPLSIQISKERPHPHCSTNQAKEWQTPRHWPKALTKSRRWTTGQKMILNQKKWLIKWPNSSKPKQAQVVSVIHFSGKQLLQN